MRPKWRHAGGHREPLNMKVKRIVANVEVLTPAAAKRFYQDVLGLDLLIDLGSIATYGSGQKMNVQISFMFEGGSDTPTRSVDRSRRSGCCAGGHAGGRVSDRVLAGRRALGRSAILRARSLREARQYPHSPP